VVPCLLTVISDTFVAPLCMPVLSVCSDDWCAFNPRSNVLWLHYVIDKLLKHKEYSSQKQKALLRELRALHRSVLDYDSATRIIASGDIIA